MRLARFLPLLALAGLFISGGAEAHQAGATQAGFAEGLLHPLTGADHLLAMVALGAWAAMVGGAAAVALPLVFPAAMLAGGLLGAGGIGLPLVEPGIALSVMALGALVALGARPRAWVAALLVGGFALAHGHAHGAEMPQAASPAAYGLGVLAMTLLLHLAGFSCATMAKWLRQPLMLRAGGAVVGLMGTALLLG